MSLSSLIAQEKTRLSANHAFFQSYTFNEHGAPIFNGSSPVDLGMYMLVMQEMGPLANSSNLSSLLSVSVLTCKNWKKKLTDTCLCDIEWGNFAPGKNSFKVKSSGIFDQRFYDEFSPYFRLVIDNWSKSHVR